MPEAVSAKEAVTALDEETAKEALVMLFEPNGPYTFDAVTNEAVATVVATGAHEALTAQDAVPNKEPVIPAVTFKDPVTIALPFTSSFAFGVVVPIPAFPDESIRIFSPPLVTIRIELSACEYSNLPTWPFSGSPNLIV